MRLGVLFSGGKDSVFAAFLARQAGHELSACLTIVSRNPESFMFHTPTISLTREQARLMGMKYVAVTTEGEEERELESLRQVIATAGVEGVVTGAVGSVYQATRIQRVCAELGVTVFNPLWLREQLALLQEIVDAGFEVIVSAVAAYPLGREWVGRRIDASFIAELRELQARYGINPAGEGGEFETLVLDCPLFAEPLVLPETRVVGADHSFRLVLGGEQA